MPARIIAMTSAMSSGQAMSFDRTLVVLSFVISVFASFVGLQCTRRARARAVGHSFAWLAAAAVSIGGGAIWSMHFIGLLAYRNDVTLRLNVGWTLLSLVVAIATTAAGLYLASRGRPSVRRYLSAGVITGLGIAGTHYLGRYAMPMNASLNLRWLIVALSFLIAVVAASGMLLFAGTVTSTWATAAASALMAVGIGGAFYTGLAATVVSPRLELSRSSAADVDPLSLALPVFGIASVLLFVLLFVVLFDDVEHAEPFAVTQPS
jgi:NO-binding membrane sensor protein with MHYT domain